MKVSKRLPLVGWVSVGANVLRVIPQVRRLERPFPVPGWKVVSVLITPVAVTVRMESDDGGG